MPKRRGGNLSPWKAGRRCSSVDQEKFLRRCLLAWPQAMERLMAALWYMERLMVAHRSLSAMVKVFGG